MVAVPVQLVNSASNSSLPGALTVFIDSRVLLPHAPYNVTHQSESADEYDNVGASLFSCAVIFTYGFSMLLLVAGYARRKTGNRKIDSAVNDYFKQYATRLRESRADEVTRTYLQCPGHFIIPREAYAFKPQDTNRRVIPAHHPVFFSRMLSSGSVIIESKEPLYDSESDTTSVHAAVTVTTPWPDELGQQSESSGANSDESYECTEIDCIPISHHGYSEDSLSDDNITISSID